MDRMKLSVAPLRYGAGLKGKVGASMASGLPVVVSEIAAEGFNTTHQKIYYWQTHQRNFVIKLKIFILIKFYGKKLVKMD